MLADGDVFEGILKEVRVVPGKQGKGNQQTPWLKLVFHCPDGDNNVEMGATAMIAEALELPKEFDLETPVECRYIGHVIQIELGTPAKLPSGKGSDAWNIKVGISEKAVIL